MSVGSQALERSTLEAKDRESLHQIATAMGGKPGSRAKKADIITMILDLAGVTSSTAPAAPAAEGGDEQLSLHAPSGADAPDPAPASSGGSAASTNGNGNGHGGEPGGRADAERNGTEVTRADDQRERSHDTGGASRSQPASSSAPGRGDEGESSSRRRRRRGRDRQGQAGGTTGGQAPAAEEFQGEPVEVSGLLDLRDEGYGFLRVKAYLPSKEDVYVSVKQVRQFGLRKGDALTGAARPASRNEKNPALLRIDQVNGKEPELNKARPRFEELTPLPPDEPLVLTPADDGTDLTTRVVDLITPLARGQRGLIVSPPRSGRTTILKRIGEAIEAAQPDVTVIALLVDARPEEVTTFQQDLEGQVVASTFDRPVDEHTMVAELTIERAKRLVEEGRDVVVLIDGLTRLARAYHLTATPTGRTVAEGVDAAALYPAKRIFGAGRNVEEGGSLTILATVQVDTGSAVDDAVVEELGGASNVELHLDRWLADRRTFPAVDVVASATGHEELLVDPDRMDAVQALRRELAELAEAKGPVAGPGAALEALLDRVAATTTNDELLDAVPAEGA